MKKKTIAEFLAKFYLRYGRGTTLIDWIQAIFKAFVYFGGSIALIKYQFGVNIPPKLIIVFIPVWFIACYVIGYIDEKVGFWKFQNKYASQDLNPWGQEVSEQLKKIEEKLSIKVEQK